MNIEELVESMSDNADHEPDIVNIRGRFSTEPHYCAEVVWCHHDGDISELEGYGDTLLEALEDLYTKFSGRIVNYGR